MTNVNTASIPELESLPGISATLAARIEAAVRAHGAFADRAALEAVVGFIDNEAAAQMSFGAAAVAAPAPSVATVTPAVAPEPFNGDIADTLNHLTIPTILPKGNYTCNSAVALRASVDFSGSTVTFPQLPNNQSNIRFVAPDLTVKNLTSIGGYTVFESEANHCGLQNVNLKNPGQAFKTSTGGFNSWMTDVTWDSSETVGAYLDRARRFDYSTTPPTPIATDPGVVFTRVNGGPVKEGREYVCRGDVPATGPEAGHIPSGFKFIDCQFTNYSTVKDTFGGREMHDVYFGGTVYPMTGPATAVIVGNMRQGQGQPATNKLGEWANNWTFRATSFISTGSPRSACSVDDGAVLDIQGCVFTGYEVPPLTAGNFSQVTEGSNVQQSHVGQHVPEFFAASATGKRIGLGGDMNLTIAA